MMGDASWKGATLVNDMSGRVSKGMMLSKILRWLRGGVVLWIRGVKLEILCWGDRGILEGVFER